MRFDQVIKKYGYPILGKKQARFIHDLQSASDRNTQTVNLRLTGYNSKGQHCPTQKLAEKYVRLANAPFKVSERCCDVMKKRPFSKYNKDTGRVPFTGEMACESDLREKSYLKTGCNALNTKKPKSMPLAVWTEQDILEYIKTRKLSIAAVYGDVVSVDGSLTTSGVSRTGCMFCMFGAQCEKQPNRFQRMKETHPRQYAYCMKPVEEGGLGLRDVLEYINVPYE
jgi:3'-phosphoadenosine 5'-phosphosulfate sulfotransferase (PAPS reductase)/FAD synthetase